MRIQRFSIEPTILLEAHALSNLQCLRLKHHRSHVGITDTHTHPTRLRGTK